MTSNEKKCVLFCRHVKVYDVGTYDVVHTLDYPGSVLSLGVSVCICTQQG